MDASNPIVSNDRVKYYDLRKKNVAMRRQNLTAVGELLARARNVALPVDGTRNNFQTSCALAFSLAKNLYQFDFGVLDLSKVKNIEEVGKVPITSLKSGEVQIHPPKVNNKSGFVHVNRTFGQDGGKDEVLLRGLLEYFDHQYIQEIQHDTVFCNGTPEGFEKRLDLLLGRKTRTPYSEPQSVHILKSRMPINMSELPDWNDHVELLTRLSLTYTASAGAPYWKNKGAALEELESVVLPMVVQAIRDGTLTDLYNKHPELFLVEVKNKQDRYERSKMDEKCRPYGNLPFHFGMLFSMILQPFTDALKLWDSSKSWNAYGFSASKGGYLNIYERLKRMKRDPIVGVYGDDVEVYYKKGGKIKSLDPDFKQMDGSVDVTTAKALANYIYMSYSTKHGASQFWRAVLDLWVQMATSPLMIIHGTSVYKKTVPGGIISGVVGTTLLDTAKSMLGYHGLLEYLANDIGQLEDEAKCSRYLLEQHGLTVKPGTWNPVNVNMEPQHLEHFNANKYLGMERVWWQDDDESYLIIPYLQEEDWVKLFLCPRNSEVGGKMSKMAKMRRSFDRLRGLLVTGAVFNTKMRNVSYSAINSIDPIAIHMAVQAGEGKGERPDVKFSVGEDFEYADSAMVPTMEWTADIYRPTPKGTKPFYLIDEQTLSELVDSRETDRHFNCLKFLRKFDNYGDNYVQPFFEETPPMDIDIPTTGTIPKTNLSQLPIRASRRKLQMQADYAEAIIKEVGPMPTTYLDQYIKPDDIEGQELRKRAEQKPPPVPWRLHDIKQSVTKGVVPDGYNIKKVKQMRQSSLYQKSSEYKDVVERLARLIDSQNRPMFTEQRMQIYVPGVVNVDAPVYESIFKSIPDYGETGLHWLNTAKEVNKFSLTFTTTVHGNSTHVDRPNKTVELYVNDGDRLAYVGGKEPVKDLKTKIAQELYNMGMRLYSSRVVVMGKQNTKVNRPSVNLPLGTKDPTSYPVHKNPFVTVYDNINAAQYGEGPWNWVDDAQSYGDAALFRNGRSVVATSIRNKINNLTIEKQSDDGHKEADKERSKERSSKGNACTNPFLCEETEEEEAEGYASPLTWGSASSIASAKDPPWDKNQQRRANW